jgi:hypothetical protein
MLRVKNWIKLSDNISTVSNASSGSIFVFTLIIRLRMFQERNGRATIRRLGIRPAFTFKG